MAEKERGQWRHTVMFGSEASQPGLYVSLSYLVRVVLMMS